jgi:hypothetical protein
MTVSISKLFCLAPIEYFQLNIIARQCRRVFAAVTAALYSDVVLTSLKQCENTLSMLRRNPAIARHVQRLTIRFDGNRTRGSWAHRRDLAKACEAVKGTVASSVLESLQTFSWDNVELPPDDGLWVTLRFWCVLGYSGLRASLELIHAIAFLLSFSCPQLRHVKTSMGHIFPSPCSHVSFRASGAYTRR